MSTTVVAEDLDRKRRTAAAMGLRSASAGMICLITAVSFHLPNPYLSVFTAHLANLQFVNTPFQKMVERLVGRLVGVFYCTLLVIFFRHTPLLCMALLAVSLLPIWYIQASGKFAYGSMLAAVFMAQTVATGFVEAPGTAVSTFTTMALQLILGALSIELINFATGAEQTLSIIPGGSDLIPIRREWISRAFMLTALTLTTILLSCLFDMPVGPTTVSALILGATPNPKALEVKGIQRAGAALIVLFYSAGVLLLLARIPSFTLLLVFLFLALFLASYIAQTSPRFSYLGLQAGIVAPMVLVVSPAEIADLNKAMTRLVGIAVGFTIALIFQELWPVKWQT